MVMYDMPWYRMELDTPHHMAWLKHQHHITSSFDKLHYRLSMLLCGRTHHHMILLVILVVKMMLSKMSARSRLLSVEAFRPSPKTSRLNVDILPYTICRRRVTNLSSIPPPTATFWFAIKTTSSKSNVLSADIRKNSPDAERTARISHIEFAIYKSKFTLIHSCHMYFQIYIMLAYYNTKLVFKCQKTISSGGEKNMAAIFKSDKDTKIFETHLNPIMLVFWDSSREVLSVFLVHFVLAKLATSGISVRSNPLNCRLHLWYLWK